MDGCSNQYSCAPAIYILSCIALIFSIIVDRVIFAPIHGKDVVDGLNARDKWMLKLEMANISNPELIFDNPNFYKFAQVHKNGSHQAVILSKEYWSVLSLIHTRDKRTTNSKNNPIFPHAVITIKT